MSRTTPGCSPQEAVAFGGWDCRAARVSYCRYMRVVFIWLLLVLLGAVVFDLSREGIQARSAPEALPVHVLS